MSNKTTREWRSKLMNFDQYSNGFVQRNDVVILTSLHFSFSSLSLSLFKLNCSDGLMCDGTDDRIDWTTNNYTSFDVSPWNNERTRTYINVVLFLSLSLTFFLSRHSPLSLLFLFFSYMRLPSSRSGLYMHIHIDWISSHVHRQAYFISLQTYKSNHQ